MKSLALTSLTLFALAAAQPASVAFLKPSAPVGSVTELRSLTTSSLRVSELQVSAVTGSKATPAQVEKARRSLQEAVSAINKVGVTSVPGKVFFKVTSRDAGGNTTLTSSFVSPSPAGQSAKSVTLRLTQVIGPDGQPSGLTLTSDDPQRSAALSSLTPEQLQQQASRLSGNVFDVYRLPLEAGEEQTNTLSVDVQELMNTVLGALAGPETGRIFGNFKASPVPVTTITTYRGLNTAQQHLFDTSSEYGAWKLSLTSQDKQLPLTVSAELLEARASGTSAYTSGGFPAQLTHTTNMTVQMQLLLDDVQVSLTIQVEQGFSMQPK